MQYYFLNTQRKAIAMIELIFAIVIMGIVLLGIPNLVNVSTSSGFTSLQQEAIATASSQINLIMTKNWDENNTLNDKPILRTDSTTFGLPLSQRAGIVQRDTITTAGATLNATPIANLGPDINDTFDDIDDAKDLNMTLRDYNATDVSKGDMIDTDITIRTTVNYVNDIPTVGTYNGISSIVFNISPTPLAVTSNIKYISTRLMTKNTAIELKKNISLNAFSCNIGTYEPYKKVL